MRAMFGVLGLLVALGAVGLIIKKQLASTRQAIPVLAVPASTGPDGTNTKPAATVQEQSQQIQQQYKQALEGAMQQARPLPDDK
ncbi:MAG: hypothetical protein V4646_12390 [Pseudomonadota bacterium]